MVEEQANFSLPIRVVDDRAASDEEILVEIDRVAEMQ
jgi:hypothetical protein